LTGHVPAQPRFALREERLDERTCPRLRGSDVWDRGDHAAARIDGHPEALRPGGSPERVLEIAAGQPCAGGRLDHGVAAAGRAGCHPENRATGVGRAVSPDACPGRLAPNLGARCARGARCACAGARVGACAGARCAGCTRSGVRRARRRPDRPRSSSRARLLPVTQQIGPMSLRIRPCGSATSPHTWFVGPTPAVSCRLRNRSRGGASDRGRRQSRLPVHGRRADWSIHGRDALGALARYGRDAPSRAPARLGSPAILRLRTNGAIAQLEERLNGIQKVRGSNPRSSTSPLISAADTTLRPCGGGSFRITEAQNVTRERTRIEHYDHTAVEPRWQARWAELGLYRTDLHDTTRPTFYLLTMYPYPSGDLHVGHWYIKTPTDAIARYRRMHGDNVFFPIGFDAFGLPAENAAIKNRIHPREWTNRNIEAMRGQLRSMGATFDWDAEVVTADPAYYRWNQWLFLRFLEAGLAYRAKAPVDWCPNDGTLAREQVEGTDRRCWRCGAKVEKRDLEQWFLRITKYADELLDFSGIDWPEPVRIMQTNWIGRSDGAEVVFT